MSCAEPHMLELVQEAVILALIHEELLEGQKKREAKCSV
jgi:hypothetical protein